MEKKRERMGIKERNGGYFVFKASMSHFGDCCKWMGPFCSGTGNTS